MKTTERARKVDARTEAAQPSLAFVARMSTAFRRSSP